MANSLTIGNSGVSSITLSDAPLLTLDVYGSSSVVLPILNTLASVDNAVTGTSAITLPILISSGVSGAVNGTSSITLSALLSTTAAPVTWQSPTVDGIGAGSVTLSAGTNTPSAPSAPAIDAVGNGSVTLNAT
jgi:hypothetical protein